MVLEVSKLGPFARLYWYGWRKGMIVRTTKYFDEPPSAFWDEYAQDVSQALEAEGFAVLGEEELSEDVSNGEGTAHKNTPVGSVNSLVLILFCYEHYHVWK